MMTNLLSRGLMRGMVSAAVAGTLLIGGVAVAEDAHPVLNVGGVEQAGGSIKGVVKFDGKQLARKAIRMDADRVCVASHTEPPQEEKYVWGDNGTLQNVFVYVSKGVSGTFPAPTRKPELDQIGCTYIPHVQGVVVNNEMLILNGDNTLHNVSFSSQNNGTFNEGMPVKGMKLLKKFGKPEMATQFKCDVHPWMSAYLHVMDHPFFAVTQQDGTFEIRGLPPGDYEVSFWHEMKPFTPDKQNVPVKVEEGKAAEVAVTYAPPKK